MSDAAEKKPDPTTTTASEDKPAETTPAQNEESKTEGEKSVSGDAPKTSDAVFSMFGGGPKKEKKEDDDEGKDEPSGSSKAQKGDEEVSLLVPCFLCFLASWLWVSSIWEGKGKSWLGFLINP